MKKTALTMAISSLLLAYIAIALMNHLVEGPLLRVQLPTAATTAAVPTVAGDTLTVRWGDRVINVGTVSATDITNKYVDVLVSQATLETQAFGNVTVTAEITSAASGNTSLTTPLTVKWAYDLPLAQLTSLSQGFLIQGNVATARIGISNENQGAQNIGDVNGDGFADVLIGASSDSQGGTNAGAASAFSIVICSSSVELSCFSSTENSKHIKIGVPRA